MTKEQIQSKALKLYKKHNNLLLEWCTGLGKSRVAIEILKNLSKKNKSPKILLVIAERAHRENWEKEFNKWEYNSESVIIECYASLRKYKDTEWDMIVFDEAHHLGSTIRMVISSSIKAKHVLLLSATMPESLVDYLSIIFGEFKTFTVTLKEAIAWALLPEPKIFLIPLTLDNTVQNCIVEELVGKRKHKDIITCTYEERWKFLKCKNTLGDVIIRIKCTEQQKYDYLDGQFNYWRTQYMQHRQEYIKNKWLQYGLRRKRFLGEIKTPFVLELITKLKDKKFICFCSSIEQSELLGNANTIHSQKRDSASIIRKFDSSRIKSLYAVGMLQEGQNLNGIEAGIIVQLDGAERAFIQKFGRSMRAEDPVQFLFYYKNTRDSEYLDKVLENIDPEYVSIIDNLNKFDL